MKTPLAITRQRIGKIITEGDKPVGVVVAESIGEHNFSVGFSVLNQSDKFKRDLGIKIAVGRAIKGSNAKIHPSRIGVIKQIEDFTKRSARYFQAKTPVVGRR